MKFFKIKPHVEWDRIKSNWLIVWASRIIILFIIAQCISILAVFKNLPPSIPLWYSRPWGNDQLAPAIYIFVLPVLTSGIYALNAIFAMYITTEYLIFTQSLFLSSLIVSLLSFIAIIKIIFLVL